MAIATLAITCFGFCYVSFPLSLLLDINYIKDPITQMTTPVWIFFLMTVTKMTDVWAYICGKKLGTTPFMASISPKKTRAGAIGGFLGATIGGMLFYPYLPSHMHISLLELMLLSMIVGIASAFGDLAESLLKRDANVKDSSSIPGLGGVLDICDSTLFTAPVLYMYLLSKALI
jgi:phosphatidate cytidylyltransferase